MGKPASFALALLFLIFFLQGAAFSKDVEGNKKIAIVLSGSFSGELEPCG